MKQVRLITSTYSADTFGVCSALFELGGMTVMHDASGCNSTYSTHDEPRWYDTDSLVFVSGLTEAEAVMGEDMKLADDIIRAAEDLHPAFTAIAGTPIPFISNCDIGAIAQIVEKRTGIPSFGFMTNGMRSYVCGAGEALAVLAKRMTSDPDDVKTEKGCLNILGATPLDFSLSGTVPSIRSILEDDGWTVISTWAMDTDLDAIAQAGRAEVNLVISSVGLPAAEELRKKFGTPYVIGTPVGGAFSGRVLDDLKKTASDGEIRRSFDCFIPDCGEGRPGTETRIIAESVTGRSLAAAFGEEGMEVPQVICPLEVNAQAEGVLTAADIQAPDEDDIMEALKGARNVIADPLYKPVTPKGSRLIALPHEAFSGRIWRRDIPDLTKTDVRELVSKS